MVIKTIVIWKIVRSLKRYIEDKNDDCRNLELFSLMYDAEAGQPIEEMGKDIQFLSIGKALWFMMKDKMKAKLSLDVCLPTPLFTVHIFAT